ncbi:MAG: NUDIX domain-containing protein [Parcubacteria group bacterium]|jgi:8-oxo-dGTP pyrophosphatase MutT (NUDIX family)
MSKDRFRIVPAAYLILFKDDKILLLRRFNTGYNDGNYSLVAGHLDGNETFRQTLAREAKEEAGLEIRKGDMKVVHLMNRYEKANPVELKERVDVFIRAQKWKGEPCNLEPHRCDDLKWFPLDKLPENTIPCVRQAINCIRKNIFYSEYGWEKT